MPKLSIRLEQVKRLEEIALAERARANTLENAIKQLQRDVKDLLAARKTRFYRHVCGRFNEQGCHCQFCNVSEPIPYDTGETKT